MNDLLNTPTVLREWLAAIGILLGTFVVTFLARSMIRRWTASGRLSPVAELAPSFARLLYIVGAQLFLEAAPLPARLALRLSDGVYVLAVLLLLGLLRRAAVTAIEWSVTKTQPSTTLTQGFIPLMRNVIALFVFFAGAIMILQHFHYDVLSLLTALGVGSLAVGLAAKETLSNMISGFTLIIDRNMMAGDRINLAGNVGDVEEIGLRSTRLLTPDGSTLIVPNSELVNTRILNLSMPRRDASASAMFRVPIDVPFERIRQLAVEASSAVALVRKDKKPVVSLTSLADGHQLVTVGFWVDDFNDVGPAISELNERMLATLGREGIPLLGPPGSTPARSS